MSDRFHISDKDLDNAWHLHWQAYLAEVSRKNGQKLLEDKK
jgi:hypothetical protein